MKKTIFITTDFIAFHKWENAPESVAFLQNIHRHKFFVKMFFKVSHNDRDLEFFIQKRKLDKYIEKFIEKTVGSCEMIAEELMKEFDCCRVEVSEDMENGAIFELN